MGWVVNARRGAENLAPQRGFVPRTYQPVASRYTLSSVQHTDEIQGGSNMTGTDLCVNKPHCAAAVRP